MGTLEATRDAVARQRLSWDVGDTPVGALVAEGRFSAFGLKPSAQEPSGGRGRLSAQSFAYTTDALPRAVDWRNADNGGHDYTTPVRNQKNCGSCVAFTVTGAIESRVKINRHDPHHQVELSPAHLFFCGNKRDDPCSSGWSFGPALQWCRDHGVGSEADFRYQPQHLECQPVSIQYKVPRWGRRISGSDRKQALAKRGPVVGGMNVYTDFGWYKGGIYRPSTSEVAGLHAICIIGYNDDEGCWIVKNSWGTAWGEGGYVRIGYGTCGIDSQFPFYDLEVQSASKVS